MVVRQPSRLRTVVIADLDLGHGPGYRGCGQQPVHPLGHEPHRLEPSLAADDDGIPFGIDREHITRLGARKPEATALSYRVVNDAAVNALLCEMLLHTLNDESAAPVIFLPQFSRGNKVPFKVTSVSIATSDSSTSL